MATSLQYRLSLFCPVSGVQRHASFQSPDSPGFLPTLTSASLSFALPDIQNQSRGKRTGSVQFVKVNGHHAGSLLPADILAVEKLPGIPVLLEAYDVDAAVVRRTLYGVVSAVGNDLSSLDIEGDDPSLFEATDFPTLRAIELFPSLEVVNTARSDMPPIVVQGSPDRKGELPCAHATFLRVSFTLTGPAPFFRYVEMTGIQNYPVSSGDILVYEVSWDANDQCIAMDLKCTDGTYLSIPSALDQNSVPSIPTANLNAYTPAFPWYRREIPLSALVGKTIDKYMVACQPTTAGTKGGYIANARILDSIGSIKVYLVDEVLPTVATALDSNSNAGNTHSFVPNRVWDFGPIRANLTGTMTAPNVYREEGRLIDASEYTLTGSFFGYKFLRFTTDQRDGSGKRMRVLADLRCDEFQNNPAIAAKFWLTDNTGYGAGQTADGSFDTAAFNLFSLGLNHLVGAVDSRQPLATLLQRLSWYGLTFNRTPTGTYTAYIDSPAAHGPASAMLYEGHQDGALFQSNCSVTGKTYTQLTLDTQVKQVRVLALRDPGFQQESSLISAVRSRAVSGASIDLDYPYVGTGPAADKICDYEFKRRVGLDQILSVEVGMVAVDFALGQLVTVYAPNSTIDGRQFEMRQIDLQDLTHTLTLAAYSDPFTYAAGKVNVAPAALVLRDYSMTTPSPPTQSGGVTYSTRLSTEAGAQGRVETVATIAATAPTTNRTHLIFEAYPAGSGVLAQQLQIPVTSGAQSASFLVEPGLRYDYIAYTRNAGNTPDHRDSAPITPVNWTNQLAMGKGTGPGTGLTLTMTGGYQSIDFSWNADSGRDLRYYELQYDKDPSFTLPDFKSVLVDTTRKHVTGFNTNETWYGRVRAWDRSNNFGAFSNVASLTLTRKVGRSNDFNLDSPWNNPDLAGHPWGNGDITNSAIDTFKRVAVSSHAFALTIAGQTLHSHTVTGGTTNAVSVNFPTTISPDFSHSLPKTPLISVQTSVSYVIPFVTKLDSGFIGVAGLNLGATTGATLTAFYW